MLTVLTSRVGLISLFGTGGAERVLDTVERLLPAWGADEHARLVIVDDEEKQVPRESRAVLLVGGPTVMPHQRLPNPVTDRSLDPDTSILNDDHYGVAPLGEHRTAGHADPTSKPVGRLPDFGPKKLDDFIALLEASAAVDTRAGRTFALTNHAWRTTARSVLREHGGPYELRTSPGWTAKDPEWSAPNYTFFYFKLHGFDHSGTWRSFDRRRGQWVDAVKPGQVSERTFAGATVFAENCYGANATKKHGKASVAGAMLQSGVKAFVGSTGLAYSSHSEVHRAVVANADQLAECFVKGLADAKSIGQALWCAKQQVVEQAKTVFAQKTAHQFVLYGNPMAKAIL